MDFMNDAIRQAKKASAIGEVPIGAVIVQNGKIVARGYNKRETKKNALLHAEIDAINKACNKLGGWRLPDCEMYVTLEPCPMCMGAIISARIERVYFGAYDEKSGAAGSVLDLSQSLPHKVDITGGVMEDECRQILSDFFKNLRKNKSKREVKQNEI
ncbi:MAG: tRNA adenosine(34) deaminase TadA [Eubacteriales bacterium]|nr:tRNA adenosine(34) deaminase TadA [Eubacteriales bacterium]